MRATISIVPALALLVACATPPAALAETHEGPVALGQTAYVGGPRVTPLSVVEDSRCPADVTCIWAGRVIVRARVAGGAWERTMDLTLGEPQQVADGMLELVSVTPGRTERGRPQDESYRFGFEFDGGL